MLEAPEGLHNETESVRLLMHNVPILDQMAKGSI